MVFQNITLNLTALESINPINITPSETTLSQVISVANSSVNDYIIFATMFIILIVIYLTLSDKTPYQDFGYDDIRALSITLNICVLMGLTIVSVGWSDNFKAIGIATILWLLSLITIYIIENRE